MSASAKAYKLATIFCSGRWRWALLRTGVAAAVEHWKLFKGLGKLNTVVDIGANRGQFALVARAGSPNAKVLAFEPLPKPAKSFVRVFSSDDLVKLHVVAIGPVVEAREMHISARDDSSSLLPITPTQVKLFPGTGEVSRTQVRVGPLSEFLVKGEVAPPALLKLDVQGFELEALAGCEALLQCFEWIYAECSFKELYAGQAMADEVVHWLRERGFALAGVHNMLYSKDGAAVQGDFLFRRLSKNQEV